MNFKRARSDEQRAERRRKILDTAAEMLTEMPAAKLSLNELSRRVCLAKSNVLRYFESREAILLELLDAQVRDWIVALEDAAEPIAGTPRERGDRLAALLADSLAQRPMLCDLLSAQAAVLEQNVSADVVIAHKHATMRSAETLVTLVRRHLPELDPADAQELTAVAVLIATAAWPHSQPTAAVEAAYAADPVVAALRMDFAAIVGRTLAVTISGLLAR
ncbi:TetR family transcriptional regulator [Nocardia jiangxiensis]|uniref:TetR family transcriptional regulator n=1 Tax=Nocardia jiangxiensis TaxID=282685 RepID=A0ABW6RTR6_9NOCA